jgi:protein-disulfide isomerase
MRRLPAMNALAKNILVQNRLVKSWFVKNRQAMLAVVVLGLGLAPLASTAQTTRAPAPGAVVAPAFTSQQQEALGGLVKDYLLKNPEVIQEALVELDKRQKDAEKAAQKKAVGEFAESLRGSTRNIVLGNPDGDVTLVEFFDYNCGYCKKALSDIRELLKSDPKLRLVIKDFPVLGPDSVEASLVALAAKLQLKPEAYWEFHQKLLETKGKIGKERALQVAREVGADQARLIKDLESVEVQGAIEEAMRIGDALKLQGTPAFILGDEIIFGVVGAEPLKAAIAGIRQCGKATCT